MNVRVLTAAVAIVAAASSVAMADTRVDRYRSEVAITPNGSLLIDNMIGTVTVVGGSGTTLRWEAVKTVRGASANDVQEGRAFTKLALFGRPEARALRTVIAYPLRNGRWES